MNQDTFFVGHLKGVGKVYLHAVVNTYSNYAFGFLHVSKQPEAAVAVLHNEALPFYAQRSSKIENVLTDNGREFCGSESHPYRIYLELNEIGHKGLMSFETAVQRIPSLLKSYVPFLLRDESKRQLAFLRRAL